MIIKELLFGEARTLPTVHIDWSDGPEKSFGRWPNARSGLDKHGKSGDDQSMISPENAPDLRFRGKGISNDNRVSSVKKS